MARSYFYETKTLIWNKIMFGLSNLLNLAEMVEKDLIKSISKKDLAILLFLSDLSLLIVKTSGAYH